jgi:hypothetical protein
MTRWPETCCDGCNQWRVLLRTVTTAVLAVPPRDWGDSEANLLVLAAAGDPSTVGDTRPASSATVELGEGDSVGSAGASSTSRVPASP